MEPLYQILKSAFPSHENLTGRTPQAWWLQAKGNLRTGVDNLKRRGVEEEYDSKTASLYIVNKPLLSRFKYGRMKVLQKADMLHIMQNLLRSRKQNIVRRSLIRAQILISAYAISRGGEVKWCRFSYWNYDGRFCVLDIGWSEIKTGNWYAMPLLNFVDPDLFEVDPIHALACVALFDNSFLNRYGDDNKDFVFLDLHNINDESVSTRFSNTLQEYLPKEMSKVEKDRYTSKTWRKSGCTLTAHHPDVSRENAIALSGHKDSGGGHYSTYVDYCGIGLQLPASMALTEHKHVHDIPCPPTFSSITGNFTEALKDYIIEKLFPTNLPQFMKKERLYAVREDMAATLIMSYKKMKARYGGSDPTVNKLATVFIADPRLSLSMLITMSTEIRYGFIKNNEPSKLLKQDDVVKITDAMNHNSATNAVVSNQMTNMVSSMENLTLEVQSISITQEQQQQQQQHVVTPASARKRTRREQNNNEDTTTTTNNSNSMLNDDNDNNFVQEIQTTPINTPTFVGVEIKEVLRRLYDLDLIKHRLNADGTFIDNYFNVAYTLDHTQTGLFVSGVQVMFASCTPLQLLQLRKVQEATDQEINQVYREVSQQTLDFMLLLEKKGTDRDSNGIFVVPAPATANKKSKHRKPLSAVGSRAVKWKKCVKYGRRLQEKNYHTSMISCCNKRDIVVPCSTLDYFGNNDDTNNNNNNNNNTNRNRTILGNNNNNTNPSNNSRAMYSTNNEGFEHEGIMAAMGQMT